MRFIDRLFPFLDSEIFFENQLTSYWLLLLFLIFFISWLYLVYKLRLIGEIIKKEDYKNHKNFIEIWEAYLATFSSYGKVEKTTEPSENFFNENTILYSNMNLRTVNNISNTLIGLGILGTFVGLTYGIADSNFETTEAIKLSINNLLSGMGTAFVTSIWGMGLSLIFTNIFKFKHTLISRKIQNLCFKLDSANKIKQSDLDLVLEEKQRNIINELFNEYLVADTDEGKQMPKNVFRQLLEESVKQTRSLQTFSDDLGESIQVAMEKLIEDNTTQMSVLIEEKLIPVLEDLKQIKEESGTEVIENVVKKLADSMKEMMEDFKSSITGDTKQEMEGLAERLTVVSESLVGIPNTMTDITLQVAETIEALKETVIKNIEISNKEASDQNKQTREVFTNATNEYKSTVEDIQDHMELLLSTQKDNIRQVSEITNTIHSTLDKNSMLNQQFDRIIQQSKVVALLIESTSNKFENSSTSLSISSETLRDSISNFNISNNKYLQDNVQLLKNQGEILNKTKDVAEIYGNRFETIEAGLKNIFEQIQIGLKEYQLTTTDNLNKYLTNFSTVLTQASQGLENNVSGLNDLTEELIEQIEKMKIK